MATVPSYGNYQVSPSSPGQRFDAPQMGDIAGRQAQEMGAAQMRLGGAIGKEAMDAIEEANQLRVIDASNSAKEKLFDLLYHPESGLFNQKGKAALDPVDGKSLRERYTDQFKQATDDLSQSLGNDQQRVAFARNVASMQTQLYGEADRHLSNEFTGFKISTLDGTVANSKRDIALIGATGSIIPGEDGRTNLQNAIDRITASVREKARMTGQSQTLADAAVRKELSDAHTMAIGSALESGKLDYAHTYFNQFKDQMDANDILRVQGKMTGQVNAAMAQRGAMAAEQRYSGDFIPSDMTRLTNIVMGIESGGKRYGGNGELLTSPKGAKGEMQVMDATNRDPGFGVTPARDNSPEELARVGRDYLGAMVSRYGDVGKALAAYNAGPGAVDSAIAKAKNPKNEQSGDWLSQLPKETQAYVAKGLKLYGAGEGRPSRPTEKDFVDYAVSSLGQNASPEQIRLTTEEAKRRFDLNEKAVKTQEEQAVTNAMRGVMENGGRYTDLPANVRAAIPPKEVDTVINFAQKISKGDDSTSLWLYNKLENNPQALAQMSDDKFFALRTELSQADFKHFSDMRAKLVHGGQGSNGPGDLNTQAIKETLDARLSMMNIDPSPKSDGGDAAARVGAIRKFVNDYFTTAQMNAGKKFTDQEVAAQIDMLFAKNATFRSWFSTKSGPMLGLKAGDIPSEDKDAIKKAFKANGVDSPTDAQILDIYWKRKLASK